MGRRPVPLRAQVDDLGTHPRDFAILVRGLPPTATDEGKILEFFEAHAVPDRSCAGRILKVVVGYDVREFTELAKQRLTLALQMKDADAAKKEMLMRQMTKKQQRMPELN